MRLARSLNHEPRQLAKLVEGMLGARELWLPKLMQPVSDATLRAEIDRLLRKALESELAAVSRGLAGSSTGRRCSRSAAQAAAAGAPESPARVLAAHSSLPPPVAEIGGRLARAGGPAADERRPAGIAQVGRREAGVSGRERKGRPGRLSSAT